MGGVWRPADFTRAELITIMMMSSLSCLAATIAKANYRDRDVRYLLFALVGVLCFSYTSAGQKKTRADLSQDQEIVRLRAAMNLPPERSIAFVSSKELPDKVPIKVYALAFSPLADGPQAVTRVWVAQWNKENAAKYGSLEAVDEISQADLILLWFVSPAKMELPEITEAAGRNPLVLIMSYLIVQRSTGSEIVWKRKGLGFDYKFSSAVDKELNRRMKARTKALKK